MKKKIIITLTILGFVSSVFSQNIDFNKNLTSEIDSLLNQKFKADEPGCVVVISKGGKTIYENAVGLADLEYNIPLKPDMVFEIASNSKQFTSVAILQLVEQGKIALDDPIEKHIIGFPTHEYKITIENLMTHTSGLTEFFGIEGFNPDFIRIDHSRADFLEFLKKAKVNFAPGTKFGYSSTGYILLAYIIEKVSGLTYQNYIEDNIFKKSQMSNSYYGSYHKIIKNRASGYSFNKENMSFENLERVSWTITTGAADIMCNAEDFIKFYSSLNAYKLISKENLEKTRTSYRLSDGSETGYGFGLNIRELEGIPFITHIGSITGYFTTYIYFPREDIHAVMFTNCDAFQDKVLDMKIGERIFKK